MDEAEKYQQRLQAIAEKRRMQEEEEKVRRQTEEEWLKLAQHKRKSLREQWLMEATTEPSAEDSERPMEKEKEKTEPMIEESSQTGENEPSIQFSDDTEKPAQAPLGEKERNVLGVTDVAVQKTLNSKASQEDTEDKIKATTEEQEVHQSTVKAMEPADLPHHPSEESTPLDEAHFSLADRKAELITAEDNAEREEEEWEMVNCSPEENLDLVPTSDLTSDLAQTDLGMDHTSDGAVLKVEQVFIMDEEEDIDSGTSEVLNFVVAAKKSDLEDTTCESWFERSREERPPEGALQTLCLGKGAHAGTSALSNISGMISEEPPVECKQNLPHLPAHTTQAVEEILGDSTVCKGEQSTSASRSVNVEWKEASGPDDEVFQYISLDRKSEKSPSLLPREMVAQSTEQESEIQILMPPSVTPNRAETVTSAKSNTCLCCTVM